jgi:hypothetical protein
MPVSYNNNTLFTTSVITSMEIYISRLVVPITNFQVAIDTGNGPDHLVRATLILNVVKKTA